MSHETHHQTETKPVVSFKSSFWFVAILAGLFIGAVNFISVMGHDDEKGHEEAHATQMHSGAAAPSAEQNAAEHEATEPATSGDSAHAEGH